MGIGWKRSDALTRTGASRRALIAVLAAILVLASFASSGLAQQFRYTVQSGDTIESVADEFRRGCPRMRSGHRVTCRMVTVSLQARSSSFRRRDNRRPMPPSGRRQRGHEPRVAAAYRVEAGDNPASIAGCTVSTLVSSWSSTASTIRSELIPERGS